MPSASNDEKAPRGFADAACPNDELDVEAAFRYFEENTTPPWCVSRSVFDLSLIYELLPSTKIGERRRVSRAAIDDFLARHPSGVRRDDASSEHDDLLSMREAFAEYVEVDPHPVSLATFRELVRAGVILAVYTSNAPQAPLLGVRRHEVMAFLAARQRMAERDEEQSRVNDISDRMSELLRQRTEGRHARRNG